MRDDIQPGLARADAAGVTLAEALPDLASPCPMTSRVELLAVVARGR
jgi:hypothetical protein